MSRGKKHNAHVESSDPTSSTPWETKYDAAIMRSRLCINGVVGRQSKDGKLQGPETPLFGKLGRVVG